VAAATVPTELAEPRTVVTYDFIEAADAEQVFFVTGNIAKTDDHLNLRMRIRGTDKAVPQIHVMSGNETVAVPSRDGTVGNAEHDRGGTLTRPTSVRARRETRVRRHSRDAGTT